MTDNDKKLIQQARAINCIDYYLIGDLIDKADTEEAREHLSYIRTYKRLLEQQQANGYV